MVLKIFAWNNVLIISARILLYQNNFKVYLFIFIDFEQIAEDNKLINEYEIDVPIYTNLNLNLIENSLKEKGFDRLE